MSFRITGLSAAHFEHLFGLADEELARHGARRYRVDRHPGFPERIALRDARPGESVLLVNHVHQPADTPYRASHAVFVAESAGETFDRIDEVPEVLRLRLLSLRAFDAEHMLVDADVVHGREVEPVIERLLGDPRVAYVQAHFAKPGCYACRIERAEALTAAT
jgi:hypothetical protein